MSELDETHILDLIKSLSKKDSNVVREAIFEHDGIVYRIKGTEDEIHEYIEIMRGEKNESCN